MFSGFILSCSWSTAAHIISAPSSVGWPLCPGPDRAVPNNTSLGDPAALFKLQLASVSKAKADHASSHTCLDEIGAWMGDNRFSVK